MHVMLTTQTANKKPTRVCVGLVRGHLCFLERKGLLVALIKLHNDWSDIQCSTNQ
jgi:hypothetical protein